MATMRDVAMHAGVSAKTVSRVVNNDRYVSDDVRLRVERAIDELQYVPNMLAVTFRTGESFVQPTLDAAVIRCLLVPAIMQVAGRAAWWLPSNAAPSRTLVLAGSAASLPVIPTTVTTIRLPTASAT